jgi:hypothetical protein
VAKAGLIKVASRLNTKSGAAKLRPIMVYGIPHFRDKDVGLFEQA